jgi:glutamyl-tRNA synthetase/glutamyl-Q tRNA(Asp) synthetase
MNVVSRFAPAPTGYLHLGHVVNAIHVWGLARAVGGCVLLRIEDHDRQRSRPEYERAILEDLEWLEFDFDGRPVRQSDRGPRYQAALDRLAARGFVYACECSRAEITAAAGVDGDDRRYPGTCRAKNLTGGPARSVRVRLGPSTERFKDLRHGWVEQSPFAQCGDLLVRDREGNWTYQFAVTVDDAEQGIDLVIRGDDLLASTGRQIQLARLLGRSEPPRFLHHALVMKTTTQKLSKADGDTRIRDLRARGLTAAEVIREAATRSGVANYTADDWRKLWTDK